MEITWLIFRRRELSFRRARLKISTAIVRGDSHHLILTHFRNNDSRFLNSIKRCPKLEWQIIIFLLRVNGKMQPWVLTWTPIWVTVLKGVSKRKEAYLISKIRLTYKRTLVIPMVSLIKTFLKNIKEDHVQNLMVYTFLTLLQVFIILPKMKTILEILKPQHILGRLHQTFWQTTDTSIIVKPITIIIPNNFRNLLTKLHQRKVESILKSLQ